MGEIQPWVTASCQPHKGALHSRQPTAIQTKNSFGIAYEVDMSIG